MPRPPFFTGYLPIPKALRGFLFAISVGFVSALGFAGFLAGESQRAPGPGAYRFDFGLQIVEGILELQPQPLLHVVVGTTRIPAGRTLMLSSVDKRGVQERARALASRRVAATGVILKRGDLEMLVIADAADALVEAAGDIPPIPSEDLGKWRLAGEICDGKCLAGAMRPGRGLAHKACANLCIVGGLPPVFVSTQPVKGHTFLLLSQPPGSSSLDPIFDLTGQYISVGGHVRRQGDLLIFEISYETIERL